MKKSNKIFLAGVIMLFIAPLAIFTRFSIIGNKGESIYKKITSANPTITEKSFVYSSQLDILNVDGSFDITVLNGKVNKLSIATDESTYRNIKFSASKDVLNVIETDPNRSRPKPKIKITMNNIKGIMLTGNNSLHNDNIKSDYFTFKMRGDNAAVFNGDIKHLKVTVAGESKLNLNLKEISTLRVCMAGKTTAYFSGKVDQLTILSIGNSRIFSKNLIANNVTIESLFSTNSEITIHAVHNLSVSSMKNTEINYYGNPKIDKNDDDSAVLKKM